MRIFRVKAKRFTLLALVLSGGLLALEPTFNSNDDYNGGIETNRSVITYPCCLRIFTYI